MTGSRLILNKPHERVTFHVTESIFTLNTEKKILVDQPLIRLKSY